MTSGSHHWHHVWKVWGLLNTEMLAVRMQEIWVMPWGQSTTLPLIATELPPRNHLLVEETYFILRSDAMRTLLEQEATKNSRWL